MFFCRNHHQWISAAKTLILALFPSRVENTSVILRIKQLSPIFGSWLFYFFDYITMLPVIDAEITGNIFLQILLQFQFNLLFAFSQLWCNNYPYGEQSLNFWNAFLEDEYKKRPEINFQVFLIFKAAFMLSFLLSSSALRYRERR